MDRRDHLFQQTADLASGRARARRSPRPRAMGTSSRWHSARWRAPRPVCGAEAVRAARTSTNCALSVASSRESAIGTVASAVPWTRTTRLKVFFGSARNAVTSASAS